ncbi:MAG: hypothetical protein V3S55_15300 [Nitrospiraceae bacterium]
MGALEYIKEAAAAQRHFSNGLIRMEVQEQGVKVVGFRDHEPPEGAQTYMERIITWLELENCGVNPIMLHRGAVILVLELEEDNAGS